MMNFCTRAIAAAVLGMCASHSFAEAYIGASIGQASVDTELSDFDDSTMFALSGGYQFHKNFAVEVSYVDFGEAEDDIDPVWTLEADGINVAAVGILPVTEKFELFGKLGFLMWDATLTEAGYGELGSDDGTDVSYGIGLSFKLVENFDIVAEYQGFALEDDDVSTLSVGARFNF